MADHADTRWKNLTYVYLIINLIFFLYNRFPLYNNYYIQYKLSNHTQLIYIERYIYNYMHIQQILKN